jgi:hypothetical protein
MKVRIVRRSTGIEVLTMNDFAIDSGCFITGKLTGLGLPSVRRSTGSSSGRHGGYSGRPFWGSRLLTIDGHLIGNDAAQSQDRRLWVNNAFTDLDDLAMYIEYENGNRYVSYCQLIGTPTLDYAPLDQQKTPFYLEFLANDPVFYDANDAHANTAVIPKANGGGITWPVVWPRVSAPGSGNVTVGNTGKVDIWPVITITGSMTNPIIANDSSGKALQLTGFSAPEGSEVVIDMYDLTATLDGGNIFDYLAEPPGWWALLADRLNSIRFETSDIADTAEATIYWRNGYMGI